MTALPPDVERSIEAYGRARYDYGECPVGSPGIEKTRARCAITRAALVAAITQALEAGRLRYCPRCMEALHDMRHDRQGNPHVE